MYYSEMDAANDESAFKNFIIYQPNPTKQMLLYDMASSSSILTFLKMNQITSTIRNQPNAEFMSENGRLPVVLEDGIDRPMCGFKEVFWYVSRRKNYVPKLIELAYIDWVETKFFEAEMYACWCHEPVLESYTRKRYTYDLSWPVSSVLFNRKRKLIQTNLSGKFSDFNDFLKNFTTFLTQLSKVIGNKPHASALNALIYGHANAILNTKLHPKLVEAITWQRNIKNIFQFIEEHYPS